MPRTVDLGAAPPPQAHCCACGSRVALSGRARQRGRFRCPVCRTDNRVGADGLGQPLRGPAETAAQMPQVRCTACGTTNRLPYRYLQVGRFRCWQCRQLDRVPRTLRRRARVGESAWIAFLLLVIVVASVTCVTLTGRALQARNASRIAHFHQNLEIMEQTIELDDFEPVGPAEGGVRWRVTGSVKNTLRVRATIYLTAKVLDGETTVGSTLHTVARVAAGERRSFEIDIIAPMSFETVGVACGVIGVS